MWNEYVKKHQDKLNYLPKDKKTLVINAYGGPGTGKSTACLHLTAELKKRGYVAECIQEYAKDLVWEKNFDLLCGSEKTQFIILEEQIRRVDRLYGQVDFILTDSPILLNGIYNKELTPEYEKMIKDIYNQYDSFNFVVQRDLKNFEAEGRIHNLEESIQKDKEITSMLDKYGLYYGVYNHSSIDKILDNAVTTLNRIKNQPIKKYNNSHESFDLGILINSFVKGKIEKGQLVNRQFEYNNQKFEITDIQKTPGKAQADAIIKNCVTQNHFLEHNFAGSRPFKMNLNQVVKDNSFIINNSKVMH